MTLPIGGRIALPSSINTYVSILKNTSLMYVIAYPELTTTALQINALTLQTVETFTVLAIVYLAIVWTMSAGIRLLDSYLALPDQSRGPGSESSRRFVESLDIVAGEMDHLLEQCCRDRQSDFDTHSRFIETRYREDDNLRGG